MKRNQGKIAVWNDEKGFGFIQPLKGNDKIFIHISAFNDRKSRPEINQTVIYNLSTDKQGRKIAVKVMRTSDSKKKLTTRQINGFFSIITAIIFLLSVGIILLMTQTSFLILYFYILVSIITFLTYAWDKRAAQKNNWRISENNLHLLALMGGWSGALVAQQVFRHKSKKQPFRFIFWLTVIVNISLFIGFTEGYGLLIV